MERTAWISRILVAATTVAGISTAQNTARVSLSTAGVQGNNGCTLNGISDDGRFVVFSSSATNLVAGDSNSWEDVFVHDRVTRTTVRASLSSTGAQGNYFSRSGSISGDGRWVVFASGASNLVVGDIDQGSDIFLRDTLSSVTSLVSTSSTGTQGNSASTEPKVSTEGRFVTFVSAATNLVFGDISSATDIFVKDLLTGSTTLVSVDSAGIQGNAASSEPSISPDGRFVAFSSTATNLVPGDTNGVQDAFVHDRVLGSTDRVSVSNTGMQLTMASSRPQVATSGLLATFNTSFPTVVVGDTNGVVDGFLRDLANNTTIRITVGASGLQLPTGGTSTSISGNGRFIAFWSNSANAVLADTNSDNDIFVYDRQDQSVSRASVSTGGFQASGSSTVALLSGDGSAIAMESAATNLAPFDSNGFTDVFHSDRSVPYALYCFGDGSAAPCPCGNSSPVGSKAGCLNSSNIGGRLRLAGNPSVANDTVVLGGADMKDGPCLYFQGTATLNLGLGSVLGDGLRCAAGSVIRLGIRVNVAGSSRYPGVGDLPVSVKGACMPGDVRSYQVWYRDAQTFCTPETYNLTNGLAFAWQL